MTRKKVKLDWIANESARKTTFKKRKKGLVKKISELSTLCGIKACLIVYGPNEAIPEVWPSPPEAARILRRLKKLPDTEKCKKMMDQEAFLRQRIMKTQEQLKRHNKDNKDLETSLLMRQYLAGQSLQDLNIEDVTTLGRLAEAKLRKVREVLHCHNARRIKSEGKSEVKVESLFVDEALVMKKKTEMEMAVEEMQRESWFAELTDRDEMMFLQNRGSFLQALDVSNNTWQDTLSSL